MDEAANSELLKLIENEISIGFTFLDSHTLSASVGHAAHAKQALGNARAACATATKFLHRLTDEQADVLSPRIHALEAAIEAHADENRP